MDRPGIWMWTWTLSVISAGMHVGQVVAEPHYIVAVPAFVEAGAETRFCASLLQPRTSLVMTVTLRSQKENVTLLEKTSSEEFHTCSHFKAPLVETAEIQNFEVELRGSQFYSKKVRKITVLIHKPRTFVQTDKPIYLPGQTVHFRLVTLDSKLRAASGLYDAIYLQDPKGNRVGQWLKETSNSKILQLSYPLSSEAHEGFYSINVKIDEEELFHTFKVEKYVLPKFDVTIKVADEISIGQQDFEVEACVKYTYGQPVRASVAVKVCGPPQTYYYGSYQGLPESSFCDTKTKETEKTGCAVFTFKMSGPFRIRQTQFLHITAKAEEEGTGISQEQTKFKSLSPTGKLSFVDMPKFYEQGSNVEGKVKAVYYNNTPIPNLLLYLYVGEMWSAHRLQALTTDNNGIATFSLSTSHFRGDIKLHVSNLGSLGWWTGVDTPDFYETVSHTLSAFQRPSADSKTASSLKVKQKDKPLPCGKEEDISVQYTLVREALGSVGLMYLVLSRGHIVAHGLKQVEVKDEAVTEGEVSFKLKVSPEMAQRVQVVAYAVLPKEHDVIADSADFSTEGCFSNNVSLDFSVSPAVPGEAIQMQLMAQSDSLCGVNIIDQSVVIKEPGKALSAEKIFTLLPLNPIHYFTDDHDPTECLRVRPRRSILPFSIYPGGETSELRAVFQKIGLKVVTNLILGIPTCVIFRGSIYNYGGNAYGSHFGYVPPLYPGGFGVGPVGTVGTARFTGGDAGFGGSGLGAVPGSGAGFGHAGFGAVPGSGAGFGHAGFGAVPGSGAGSGLVGVPPGNSVGSYGQVLGEPIETVRTFFPETWIWDLVEVGESGRKDVSVTVPDTITTWETEAFCLSSEGFGLAPRKKLTVFQPFFLELTLPYSIVRGENFELKATVFSFLTSCIMVKVTAAPSSDYTLTPLSGDQYTSCLCGSERKTLSWTMIPTTLGVVNVTVSAEAEPSHTSCNNEIVSVPERGRIDVVTRPLRVKAEGTEITKTHNWLLCPKGNMLTEEMEMQLPDKMIDGSARATVSVLGDILGRALKNLEGLLSMPYGCGEQNMALLAPNIYILHYLKNTQQLTPAITEKATNFLTSGYQRQLTYKDNEGAYSTFGSGPGNTWLTTFVLRSFFQAQSFIYIDPTTIQQSRTWLQQRQRPNGCFEMSGKLFNNRMKGGVSDEVTLSAYITAAFLEMKISTDDPVVKKSLSCLRESMSDLSNTYTTALLAYVFALARDMKTRSYLLQHLDGVAIREGSLIHWSQTASETSESLSVEISSYVLMAKLSTSLSAEDLGYSANIVRWLTRQQNHYGGFFSTQDTVVALQALALYSTLVFSPEGSSTVMVRSPKSQMTFDVNPLNKLLYQEKTLQELKGKLVLEVKGTACAAVQVSHHYNIPTPSDVTSLRLEVRPVVVSASKRLKVSLQIMSLYSGKESNTNMMILKIDLPSGFEPDLRSLTNLRQAQQVNLVEHKNDHVLLYFEEFFKGANVSHSLVLVQQVPVQNLKPATVTLYDYYQPSDRAQTEYIVAT